MQLDPQKFIALGLTYDDVLLVPSYSEILPREVSTATFLTKKIQLNVLELIKILFVKCLANIGFLIEKSLLNI